MAIETLDKPAHLRQKTFRSRPGTSLKSTQHERPQTTARAVKAKAPRANAPLTELRQPQASPRKPDTIDDAIRRSEEHLKSLERATASEAAQCLHSVRLARLQLQKSSATGQVEAQTTEVLQSAADRLGGTLKGSSADFDALLLEVSGLRRTATQSYLSGSSNGPAGPDRGHESTSVPAGLKDVCRSIVVSCVRFLNRYLGSTPASDATAKALERYQQRKVTVEKTAMAAVDSVFAVTKTAVMVDELAWDHLHPALSDCLDLASKVDLPDAPAASDGVVLGGREMCSVKASNIFWAYYLRRRKTSSGTSEDPQLLRCLRRSIEIARPLQRDARRMALLAVKLERLGSTYEAEGRSLEASERYLDSTKVHVEDGALLEASKAAKSMPVRKVWDTPGSIALLGRTLSAYLRTSLRTRSEGQDEHCMYDDCALEEGARGVILERQLDLLSDMLRTTRSPNKYRSSLSAISDALMAVYAAERYPLRRIRILSKLIHLVNDHPSFVSADKRAIYISEATSAVSLSGLGEDSGLEPYGDHLKATLAASLVFCDDSPSAEALVEPLTAWTRLIDTIKAGASIEDRIDEVESCLTLVTSISDYFEMKGLYTLRIPTLKLLAAIRERQRPCDEDLLVGDLLSLGALYLRLGYSGKAGLTLARAQSLLLGDNMPGQTALQWHLHYAEYLLTIGSVDKSSETLAKARLLAQADPDLRHSTQASATVSSRIRTNAIVADAYYVCSRLAFERGRLTQALDYAKRCVKLNHRVWAGLEGREGKKPRSASGEPSESEMDTSTEGVSNLSVSTLKAPAPAIISTTHACLSGVAFWRLVPALFRGLDNLSQLFSHHGMFQESIYYTQQAQRVVEAVGAAPLVAHNLTTTGRTWVRAGHLEKGAEMLNEVKNSGVLARESKAAASLHCALALTSKSRRETVEEMAAYEKAEMVLTKLISEHAMAKLESFPDPMAELDENIGKLTIDPDPPARKTVSARGRKQPATKSDRAAPAKKTRAPAKAVTAQPTPTSSECTELTGLRAGVLRLKAVAMAFQKQCASATELLAEAESSCNLPHSLIQQRISHAKQLLQSSLEKMSADAVFCVLQESTISFPSIAVAGPTKSAIHGPVSPEKSPLAARPSRAVAAKPGAVKKTAKSRTVTVEEDFVETLRRGRESIVEVLAMAMRYGSTSTVHVISSALSGIIMLLSAACPSRGQNTLHSIMAVYCIEMAKTQSLRRERDATELDKTSTTNEALLHWPALDEESAKDEILTADYAGFQKQYIDIIPPSWTALSISLSEDRSQLFVSKLQAGKSPFILRLPLDRHQSRDVDEEVFNFEQCRDELREIIDLANFSAHDARDMSKKGAKTQWWAEREALDTRLKDLLTNVENMWLGGFRGIFAQAQGSPRKDLLARFQRSFQNILDRYLPSRQKGGGGGGRGGSKKSGKAATGSAATTAGKVTLDPRILELFIGLGNPYAAEDVEPQDFEEPLTDLLYFVVDILQFNGERNAYDEIDFDSMVVETQDALSCYHAAVAKADFSTSTSSNPTSTPDPHPHTILILDKHLHAIPWESLPCMQGQSVSRLPSLGCLRDRILAMTSQTPPPTSSDADSPPPRNEGIHIPLSSGAYVLNPSGDLTSTQSVFEPALAHLTPSWPALTTPPTESHLATLLSTKQLYLYIGHGSGAQYIRSRTVKRLPRCAVALLMGCSSAALTETGEFESYGAVMGYLQAGSAAVVGCLWDVTDRDVDRVGWECLKGWGVIDGEGGVPGGGKRGKGTATVDGARDGKGKGTTSLVQAVSRGREEARLRYLNGAAVVVYGVPVYLS